MFHMLLANILCVYCNTPPYITSDFLILL